MRFPGRPLSGESALLNGLSIAASLGVVVAVFQFVVGWPIPSFMPLLMFALVFGLSMDYEIFILSRVREGLPARRRGRQSALDHRRSGGIGAGDRAGGDDHDLGVRRVRDGFGREYRIMGFGLRSPSLSTRPLMRFILIPASMSLMGRANWWPRTGCVSPSTGSEAYRSKQFRCPSI